MDMDLPTQLKKKNIPLWSAADKDNDWTSTDVHRTTV